MSKKNDDYKPVMVFYVPDIESARDTAHRAENIEEHYGYPVLIVMSEADPRVEIISVDKATVVEDIQKYLDLKAEE